MTSEERIRLNHQESSLFQFFLKKAGPRPQSIYIDEISKPSHSTIDLHESFHRISSHTYVSVTKNGGVRIDPVYTNISRTNSTAAITSINVLSLNESRFRKAVTDNHFSPFKWFPYRYLSLAAGIFQKVDSRALKYLKNENKNLVDADIADNHIMRSKHWKDCKIAMIGMTATESYATDIIKHVLKEVDILPSNEFESISPADLLVPSTSLGPESLLSRRSRKCSKIAALLLESRTISKKRSFFRLNKKSSLSDSTSSPKSKNRKKGLDHDYYSEILLDHNLKEYGASSLANRTATTSLDMFNLFGANPRKRYQEDGNVEPSEQEAVVTQLVSDIPSQNMPPDELLQCISVFVCHMSQDWPSLRPSLSSLSDASPRVRQGGGKYDYDSPYIQTSLNMRSTSPRVSVSSNRAGRKRRSRVSQMPDTGLLDSSAVVAVGIVMEEFLKDIMDGWKQRYLATARSETTALGNREDIPLGPLVYSRGSAEMELSLQMQGANLHAGDVEDIAGNRVEVLFGRQISKEFVTKGIRREKRKRKVVLERRSRLNEDLDRDLTVTCCEGKRYKMKDIRSPPDNNCDKDTYLSYL